MKPFFKPPQQKQLVASFKVGADVQVEVVLLDPVGALELSQIEDRIVSGIRRQFRTYIDQMRADRKKLEPNIVQPTPDAGPLSVPCPDNKPGCAVNHFPKTETTN